MGMRQRGDSQEFHRAGERRRRENALQQRESRASAGKDVEGFICRLTWLRVAGGERD